MHRAGPLRHASITFTSDLMSSAVPLFALASNVKALRCLLFSYDQYLDMAVSHGMAVNLQASDIRQAFDEGRYPTPGWEVEARATADKHATELKAGMRSA